MDWLAGAGERCAAPTLVDERFLGAVRYETSVLRAIGDDSFIGVDDLRAAQWSLACEQVPASQCFATMGTEARRAATEQPSRSCHLLRSGRRRPARQTTAGCHAKVRPRAR